MAITSSPLNRGFKLSALVLGIFLAVCGLILAMMYVELQTCTNDWCEFGTQPLVTILDVFYTFLLYGGSVTLLLCIIFISWGIRANRKNAPFKKNKR